MTIKNITFSLLTIIMLSAIVTSCKKDSNDSTAPVVTLVGSSYVEQFDTISSALNRGWKVSNQSVPLGDSVGWVDGDVSLLGAAYSNAGTNPGFIMSNDQSICPGTTNPKGDGIASNWLISPSTVMKNGDSIIFYTKCLDSTMGDRLQVRINPVDDSLDIGSGRGVGKFTTSLLDINPYYGSNNINYFPQTNWTKYALKVTGLNKPVKGRFAFRIFIEYSGPDPVAEWQGSFVGIDNVTYVSVK